MSEPQDSPPDAALDALEAYIDSVDGLTDEALSSLSDRHDPDSMRQRMRILLRSGKASEAALVARGRPPAAGWADVAISALLGVGDDEEAAAVLHWAEEQGDVLLWHRCSFAFAETLYRRALSPYVADPNRPPRTLKPEDEGEARRVLWALDPILMAVAAVRRVRNQLDLKSVQLAFACHLLLGDHQNAERLSRFAWKYEPVALWLANAALQRCASAPDDLVRRLREEHPEDCEAGLLSVLVQSELVGDHSAALAFGRTLIEKTAEPNEREALVTALLQVASAIGGDALADIEAVSYSILPANSTLLRLIEVQKLLRAQRLDDVEPLLRPFSDTTDPAWLQLQGAYMLQRGDRAGARVPFTKAARLVFDFHVSSMAAALEFEAGAYETAAELLEELLRVHPRDEQSRRNAASVYLHMGDMAGAARHLLVLADMKPDDLICAMNLAAALSGSGRIEDGLKLYERVCAKANPPLGAVVGRARLLKALGRPEAAFASVQTAREQFWDDPQFVGAFLDLAFAAGDDRGGHEALMRLKQLQDQGKAGPGVVQVKTLPELIGHAKDFREQAESLHGKTLKGEVPWLLVDTVLGNVSHWGWLLRTQPVKWIPDESMGRAQYSVYSTNGYAVAADEHGVKRLRQLDCERRGVSVAADLSSLITLHRLGLLSAAAEYFGKILVPAIYLTHMLDEQGRLVHHQLSHKSAAEEIKKGIEERRIQVLMDTGVPESRPMPYVNEYTLADSEEEHFYRLRDILTAMQDHGDLADDMAKEIVRVAHKPAAADASHAPLRVGSAVLCELSTLRTLCGVGALNILLGSFAVHIASSARDEIVSELRGATAQEDALAWSQSLWDALRQDRRFSLVPVVARAPRSDGGELTSVALAAIQLSLQAKVPLLADDRACQMAILNSRGDEPLTSFGSDRVVPSLLNVGLITSRKACEAVAALIEWRYRFIVPDRAVLKEMADQYRETSPGKELRAVAAYIHDCMRDPGLFSGPEPSEPPTPGAAWLFNTWVVRAAELIADASADSNWGDQALSALTAWVVEEMLPSPPKVLGPRSHSLTTLLTRHFLGSAMLSLSSAPDLDRSWRCLDAIVKAFGLTRQEYLKEAAQVINAV